LILFDFIYFLLLFLLGNSILVNASKSMISKAFDGVLKDKYFIEDLVRSVNNTDDHIRELEDEINKQLIPEEAIKTFIKFKERYLSVVEYIQIPLTELCNYVNGTETDIDKKLLEALDIVHLQLEKLIDTINQDIINKTTPWQNNMLMDIELEETIRSYISLGGTIFFALVIVLGGIPVIFFVFILISRLCSCTQNQSCEDSLFVIFCLFKLCI